MDGIGSRRRSKRPCEPKPVRERAIVLSRFRSLWRTFRRRSAFERDMDDELRLHLELRAVDLVRSGLTDTEARRRARLEFGNVEAYQER